MDKCPNCGKFNESDILSVDPTINIQVETLAKILHESGREAVEAGLTLHSISSDFVEWDDLPDKAKFGRILQASYLLRHYRHLFLNF
jgi:hypothetical protein